MNQLRHHKLSLRKSTAHKPLPAQLPRIRDVIEFPESERTCPCGCQLTEIGEDISDQIGPEYAKAASY